MIVLLVLSPFAGSLSGKKELRTYQRFVKPVLTWPAAAVVIAAA